LGENRIPPPYRTGTRMGSHSRIPVEIISCMEMGIDQIFLAILYKRGMGNHFRIPLFINTSFILN
jgi:hypothetical protein